MSRYEPLFTYLEPASIPQVVAYIQKYLAENPIISDEETIAELIREYIAAHPELLAVSSVNGETGNVVLTGSDININASSAVSIETQLQNLASMIQSASGDITQIEANISQIYTTIGTLQTSVETNASNISALQTSVSGQGTRLATAETDIDNIETAQTAQGTRLNAAEGNISSLQTRMTQAETDIDNNESSIETLNTNIGALQTDFNNFVSTGTWAPAFVRLNVASIQSASYLKIGKLVIAKAIVNFGTSTNEGTVYIDRNSIPFETSVRPFGIFGIGRATDSDTNIVLSTAYSNNNIWLSRGNVGLTGDTVSGKTFNFELIYFVS